MRRWLMKWAMMLIAELGTCDHFAKQLADSDHCQGCIFQVYIHREYCLPNILHIFDIDGKKWNFKSS